MSMTNRSTAGRYRPAWRTPIGHGRTVKDVGDIEMTATGFHRLTATGFVKVS